MAGETFHIAMAPIATELTVRIVNWVTSVITTLIIPPLIA